MQPFKNPNDVEFWTMPKLLQVLKALGRRRSKSQVLCDQSPDTPSSTTGFLSLPAELRNVIYEMILVSEVRIFIDDDSTKQPPSLLQVNRQIREETLPIYYLENEFAIKSTVNRRRLLFEWKAALKQIVGLCTFSRRNNTYAMESFLKQSGANRYQKRIRAHWQLRSWPHPPPTAITWEGLVEWASTRWTELLLARIIRISWPAHLSQRAFEFWMILICTHSDWQEALLMAHFLQWIMDEGIDCKWTVSFARPGNLKERTVFTVRLKSPGSRPLRQKFARPSQPSQPNSQVVVWRHRPNRGAEEGSD